MFKLLFAGERDRTGGLYVRESTFVRAIAALFAGNPGQPDSRSRDHGACLAEARGLRSERRRACLAEAPELRSERRRACLAEAPELRSKRRRDAAPDVMGRPGPAGYLELRHDDAARARTG